MSECSVRVAKKAVGFSSMRIQLKERAIETKVKDDALVKQRREEIIRAASQVFTQKGYHLATIRDICEASGLGPGTLYNYIKKKEDILYLIYNQLTLMLGDCLLESIKKKPPESSCPIKGSFGKNHPNHLGISRLNPPHVPGNGLPGQRIDAQHIETRE